MYYESDAHLKIYVPLPTHGKHISLHNHVLQLHYGFRVFPSTVHQEVINNQHMLALKMKTPRSLKMIASPSLRLGMPLVSVTKGLAWWIRGEWD